jgi:hypothetical protein
MADARISIIVCLALGVWIGHRFALESHRLDSILAVALQEIETHQQHPPVQPPPTDVKRSS